MAWVGIVAAAIAAGASVAGGLQQQEQAKVNAQVLEDQARVQKQAAALEADTLRRQAEAVKSRQRAAYAASGVTLEGSPLQVLEDTAAEAELDALAIRWSGSVAEAQSRRQAAEARLAGRMAAGADPIAFGVTLGGTLSCVAAA